jgi:hypothetical protein
VKVQEYQKLELRLNRLSTDFSTVSVIAKGRLPIDD